MTRPERKPNRLAGYDYSQPGAYFVTICTQDRRCVLSHIVGGGAFDAPHVELTEYGKIAEKYICSGNRMERLSVDKYVIMPNHIHMILLVSESQCGTGVAGTSRAPSPTNQTVPRFVGAFKRFCHAEMGEKIFQRSFYDHVIRGETDYNEIWQYIENNPARWTQDEFYWE